MAECSATKVSYQSIDRNLSKINALNFSDLLTKSQEFSKEDVKLLKFVAYGIISSIIISLGIIGNITNLIVLTRPNVKGVSYVYLTWLAVSDLMSLVVAAIVTVSFVGTQSKTYSASIYYSHVELPLVNAFMACSVFLVVAVTIERYFSVCLPGRFKDIHNNKWVKRLIVTAYIAAFILYIPECFKKRPTAVLYLNNTQFLACENQAVVSHPLYKAYKIVKEMAVRLGPAIILAVLNITIIITFRQTLKRRQEMLGDIDIESLRKPTVKRDKRKYRAEKRLIKLLLGIVIIFFVCNTPAALLRILKSDGKKYHFGFQLFRAIANILELSNCAMNFYFYFMCSPEIRRTFIALVTCTKPTSIDSSEGSKPSVEINNDITQENRKVMILNH